MSGEISESKRRELARRRTLLKSIGGLAAFGSIGQLLGCGAESQSSSSSSSVASSSSSMSSSSSSLSSSSSSSSSASSQPVVEGWASGGTASIWTEFPPANPFSGGAGSVCSLTEDLTLGPCYFSLDHYRQDISDGEKGVPTIFAIQALDRNCNPVPGVIVDLWHTNAEGFYSADNTQSSSTEVFLREYCANNNQRAMNSRWHRGAQVTDADGVAYFKSCFPGWYAGRTNHIHLRFVNNGNVSLDTQLAFPDALCNEIHSGHEEYIGRVQDTTGTRDSVFGSAYSNFVMDIARNEDGSMLAYKAVSLNI